MIWDFFRRRKAAPKAAQRDCKSCEFNLEGGCRRYPPARVYTGQGLDVTVFPVVANADGWWCGEYKEKR